MLATADTDGMPHARVVVLRDLAERLAIFFNATSPKHEQLAGTSRHAVLVYLASIGVQYRMRVDVEPVPGEIVARSWLERPRIPKVMDWFYTDVQPQSSTVSSRDALLEGFSRLDDTLPQDVGAPVGAVGFYLNAGEVERLELAGNRVHSRQRYRLSEDGVWTCSELVP